MKHLIRDLEQELNGLRLTGRIKNCHLKNKVFLKIEAILRRTREELDKI